MKGSSILKNQTEVLSNWQLLVCPEMVLRAQGIRPEKLHGRQMKFMGLARRAIKEGTALIRPRVALRRLRVAEKSAEFVTLENGAKVRLSGVAQKLAGAEWIIPVVATLGEALEREMARLRGRELVYQLALDGFGTAALDALTRAVRLHVRKLAEAAELRATNPLYPGSAKWELSTAQAQIFSLVDASRIGVVLNEAFMMIPRKSVSMLFGIGANRRAEIPACDECDASPRCKHKPA